MGANPVGGRLVGALAQVLLHGLVQLAEHLPEPPGGDRTVRAHADAHAGFGVKRVSVAQVVIAGRFQEVGAGTVVRELEGEELLNAVGPGLDGFPDVLERVLFR